MKQQAIRVSVVVFLGTLVLVECSPASIENPTETGRNGTGGSSGAGGAFVIVPPDAGRSSYPEDASCGDRCKVVVPYCGDGIINQPGERCDDGNAKGGDGCTAACDQIEDGWVCPNQGQACLNIVVCGDKKIMGKETCDDGNRQDGDGCSGSCQLEDGFVCPVVGGACRPVCGDKRQVGNEQCDDGNTKDGDGCNARCQLEPGFVCDQSGDCRKTVCGDGKKEGTEQCDDTQTGEIDLPFDGCYHCLLEPECSAGTCQSPCGDGQRFSDEECDDGNRVNGDGCSSDCKKETGFTCKDEVLSEPPPTKDVPVVVRDFIGLGHQVSPAAYHPDFNSHYGPDGILFGMVKATLGSNGKPAWRWHPYKPADITTDATPDGTKVPIPLPNCTCDDSAPQASWSKSSETWSGGWGGPAVTFDFNRPPCSCSDGSLCVCDNPAHLFKDLGMTNTNRRNLSSPANFAQWYTPAEGVNMVVPYTLSLTLADAKAGSYTNMSSSVSTGFDPIGATGGWIAVGKETTSGCDKQSMQNASFTTEMRFWFEYQGGEQFGFSGDDDAWVFVNRTLVVDLGALHGREDGSFTLDASDGSAVVKAWNHYYDGTNYTTTQGNNLQLGLKLGKVYEVVMFQAERNACGSNFGVTLKNFSKPKSTCASKCGDGIVAADEYCDDGVNTSKYNGCGPNCIPAPYCGDGKVQAPDEECDDGVNVSQYGGCGPGCKKGPTCGDGKVQSPWEDCDDGVNLGGYSGCDPGCHYGPRCGDGIVQPEHEECDDGVFNGGNCRQDCTRNVIL
jgi:fibro-slime domain-containing protein